GVAVGVPVARGVLVGGLVAVRVGDDGRDAVNVALAVRVGTGVTGVRVGAAVNVGGTGPLLTRRIMRRSGPKLPSVSRNRVRIAVSGAGSVRCEVTGKQNCTWVFGSTNPLSPKASCVHAKLDDLFAVKLHARSLIALATNCVALKSGGSTAG